LDFDLTDPGTLWFWVFLPISIFVWLFDQFLRRTLAAQVRIRNYHSQTKAGDRESPAFVHFRPGCVNTRFRGDFRCFAVQ
jgi:hypothetical protein